MTMQPLAARSRGAETALAEDGMTIIEVLVAAVILAIGVIALLTAFDASRRLTSSAEEHQTAATIAQQELHRIASQPWSKIALIAEPVKTGTTSTDPTYYEQTGTCAGTTGAYGPVSSPCYQWSWNGTAGQTTTTEPLVISSSGDSTSDPASWSTTISTSNGAVRLSGSVYRFITWVNDPNCYSAAYCSGSKDYKRVVVAVTGTGLNTPVVLTTAVTNPVSAAANPLYNNSAECLDGTTTVPCVG